MGKREEGGEGESGVKGVGQMWEKRGVGKGVNESKREREKMRG